VTGIQRLISVDINIVKKRFGKAFASKRRLERVFNSGAVRYTVRLPTERREYTDMTLRYPTVLGIIDGR